MNTPDHESDSSLPSLAEARVRDALAGRYTILRRIGSGGMATVYLAEDPRHQRQVAVKVLRAELASALGAERFLREIRIAAKLQHPHILPLLDSGEADGLLYYVMPYVQGESLRQRLHREGRLPIADVTRLLRDVTDALAYAHAQNVVHRDVKPDNIMLTGRYALLMDFGVAKAVSQAAEGGQSTLTTRGISIGTPAYMAPEQALADPNLDHRVDIYALGITAYEMLTDAFPFDATTPEAVISAHVSEPPKPVTDRRADTPPQLADLVMRCLRKKRTDRWQTADDLIVQLESLTTPPRGRTTILAPRRVMLLAATTSVVIALTWLGLRDWRRTPPPPASSRQVTTSGRVTTAAISADGRQLAYVERTDSSIQKVLVEQIGGGRALPIAEFRHVNRLEWTPGGMQLLVQGWKDSSWGTFVVPFLGGDVHQLSRTYTTAAPDDRHFADWLLSSKQLLIHDQSGGDSATIKIPGSYSYLWETAWSPSGRALAVAYQTTSGFGIRSVKIDGNAQGVTIDDSVNILFFSWTRDAIYYLRQVGVTSELWKVPVSTSGAPRGTPRVVMTNLEADGMDISDDARRLVLHHTVGRSNLRLLKLDTKAVHSITSGTTSKMMASFSPDGQKLAYVDANGRVGHVFVMPVLGGTPQQITYLNADTQSPAWSPDGATIAFCANEGRGWGVYTVPAGGGTPRRYPESRGSNEGCGLTWAPGKAILYRMPGNRNYAVLDPATGKQRPLIANDSVGWMSDPHYYPDGETIAVEWNRRPGPGVWLLSLRDSSQRPLVQERFVEPIGWTPDGRYLMLWHNKTGTIEGVGLNGARHLMARLPFDCSPADANPSDGRSVVCSTDESQSDAWLVENFDPDVPPVKTDE